MNRAVWQARHVVDVAESAFAARTYIEQADLRRMLSYLLARPVESACDLGCGFGRMTPLLGEFSTRVTGYEREAQFVSEAKALFPAFDFQQLDGFETLPVPDRSFDLIVTFTVLQHLIDPVLAKVAEEIKRTLKPTGLLLICEETDEAHQWGDPSDPNGMCTRGRSVQSYAAAFYPLSIVATAPRRIEPTYPRPNVGTYIAFAARRSSSGVGGRS